MDWLTRLILYSVRAFWDGRRFVSRLGHEFLAPSWFTEHFPSDGTTLDGELFLRRGAFQEAVSIVRTRDRSDRWRALTFSCFDSPSMAAKPWEERLAALKQLVAGVRERGGLHLELVPQTICRDDAHLLAELERVLALGGEGLMLRQARSLYEAKRSKTLRKLKRFLDAEARVVAHVPGKGRNVSVMGALLCEGKDGKRFKVGTGFCDAQRANPPPVGAIVTYRYQELTSAGLPRFPSFVRIRDDLAPPL